MPCVDTHRKILPVMLCAKPDFSDAADDKGVSRDKER